MRMLHAPYKHTGYNKLHTLYKYTGIGRLHILYNHNDIAMLQKIYDDTENSRESRGLPDPLSFVTSDVT